MLEQIFGSKTRVKLLQLFLNNPYQPYYLRQLARKLKTQLNSVRREVNNLEKLGIIKSVKVLSSGEEEKKKRRKKRKQGAKKYFLVNLDFILYPELKGLFLKAQLMLEKNFVKQIEKMAKVKLFILTGIFIGLEGFATDMLLVGSVNRKRLAKLIRNFQRALGHEINYTVMSQQEYKYRHDITDRFLYDILENKKIIIINKLDV